MARNAWRVMGLSFVVAGGVALADKPAELPVRTEVQGKATPVVTEEHFQAEKAPPPRLLPAQIREDSPNLPPTFEVLGQKTDIYTVDLDTPIHATSFGKQPLPPLGYAFSIDRKARAAFDIAEMHFRACDTKEARSWYLEVIKLAPRSLFAMMAMERLQRTEVIPAGAVESREPPLADTPSAENVVRIR